MRNGHFGVALTLAALVSAQGFPAHGREARGGDKARATALLKEGAALLEQKDFEPALEKFTEAYRLVPSPKIQFNIGLAHEGLARPAEATRAYQLYVDGATSDAAARRAEAETRIKNLRPRVTLLHITSDDKGASVLVDGAEVGVTPLAQPIVVNPGSHQLVVNSVIPGGAPWTRALRAEAGRTIELQVALAPPPRPVNLAPPPPRDVQPTETPAPSEAKVPALVSTPSEPVDEPAPLYKRGWFWGVVGGVVVAGAVGAFLLIPRETKHVCAVEPCL